MVRVMRAFFRAIRFIVPWVFRVIIAILETMAVAISSLLSGVPQSMRRIATEWQRRAFAAGFPTEFDRPLYYTLCVAAVLTFIVGWIALAYMTVGLLRLIF